MIKRRKKRGCDCSGHPSGNPKIATGGPCYGGGVRPAVKERIAGKLVVRAWLLAEDLDDVED